MLAAKCRIDTGSSNSDIAKEARDYIDDCWENIKGGFSNNIKHNAQAITNGLQLHEKIIKSMDKCVNSYINQIRYLQSKNVQNNDFINFLEKKINNIL